MAVKEDCSVHSVFALVANFGNSSRLRRGERKCGWSLGDLSALVFSEIRPETDDSAWGRSILQ